MAAKELVTVRTHARGHSQVMSIEIEKPRHTMPLAFTNMSNSLDEALEGVERKVIGDCGHLLFTEGKGEAALGKEIAIEIGSEQAEDQPRRNNDTPLGRMRYSPDERRDGS